MKLSEKYILSNKAEQDLQEIFNYSKKTFNLEQAKLYLNNLEKAFERIVRSPYIGRFRKELIPDVLSISESEHLIFYKIYSDEIFIVRIIHGSKDIPKQFDEI